ncbi:pentapeptide repeat-containing protein [Pseudoalteromonas rubra]|uniref:pentapeptide repeat-containing protein n=1 Tax=Pseudoalteromonas rubra TaxID=43658 RepID=UPI0014861A31|nr:pentapeptide repeat-containing protein [Pseudoalteromonas rubra]
MFVNNRLGIIMGIVFKLLPVFLAGVFFHAALGHFLHYKGMEELLDEIMTQAQSAMLLALPALFLFAILVLFRKYLFRLFGWKVEASLDAAVEPAFNALNAALSKDKAGFLNHSSDIVKELVSWWSTSNANRFMIGAILGLIAAFTATVTTLLLLRQLEIMQVQVEEQKSYNRATRITENVKLFYGQNHAPALRSAALSELFEMQVKGFDLRGANFEGVKAEALNFSSFDLLGANFKGARLAGSNFSQADLASSEFSSESILDSVNLSGASLFQSKLADVMFDEVQLFDANLGNADLTRAGFGHASMSGLEANTGPVGNRKCVTNGRASLRTEWDIASGGQSGVTPRATRFDYAALFHVRLSGARLDGASFKNANITGLHMHHAYAPGVNFSDSKLFGVYFTCANLDSAQFNRAGKHEGLGVSGNFANTSLENTSWQGATLYDVNFSHAQLTCADFTGATVVNPESDRASLVLSGADLRGAIGLDDTLLSHACGDSKTRLPDYVSTRLKACPQTRIVSKALCDAMPMKSWASLAHVHSEEAITSRNEYCENNNLKCP